MESKNFTFETSSTLIEHMMNIDGVVFREVRTRKPSKAAQNQEEISHQRSIGDKSYTVTILITENSLGDKRVETNMTPDELQEFEEKWTRLWKPNLQITEWNQINLLNLTLCIFSEFLLCTFLFQLPLKSFIFKYKCFTSFVSNFNHLKIFGITMICWILLLFHNFIDRPPNHIFILFFLLLKY